MPKYYGRNSEVRVDTKGVSGLRTSFRITMTTDGKPDTAVISIWNLNAETRALWQAPKTTYPVLLRAGFGEDTSDIFLGDSRLISSVLRGTDGVTTITCGDGEQAVKRSQIQHTLGKGSRLQDAVLKLLDELTGVDVKEAKSKVRNGNFRGGLQTLFKAKTLSGPVFEELTTLLKGYNFDHVIQGGVLRLVEKTGTIDLPQVPLVSEKTGLIGSPEAGEKGRVTLTTLLDPRIKPLHKFKLESDVFDGYYKAGKVLYVGDTHQDEWYNKIEATPL